MYVKTGQGQTGRPVQFEIAPATRETVEAWIRQAGLKPDSYLFPSRVHTSPHLGMKCFQFSDRTVR